MTETLEPSVPDLKVAWKCSIERIPEKSEPSYPFATEHKKAMKIARYRCIEAFDHRLISL